MYLEQPIGKGGNRYPRNDGKHGNLVHDIKAQKHAVPPHVRQPQHRVEVRRPGGVLHLQADWAGVVGPVRDVDFVTCSRNGAGLAHTISIPFRGCWLVRTGEGVPLGSIHIAHGLCQVSA